MARVHSRRDRARVRAAAQHRGARASSQQQAGAEKKKSLKSVFEEIRDTKKLRKQVGRIYLHELC